jgi:hypothetical protein
MKRTFILAAAVSALCAAAPAAAQYNYDARTETSFAGRIDQLQTRLDAGVRAGTIDRRESWRLSRQLGEVSRLERQYAYDGFSPAERSDLQRRLRLLRQDLRVADNRSWDRYDRYAWDDKDYYVNGRYTGRGGPVDDWIGLRIGQRATADLGLVPYSYRARYRDGGGVYYRSDGRMVYEIDARTNLVLRADPID